MTRDTNSLPKGFALEETLRNFFLKAGLFVVRGVPFSYQGNELTDVDLWMYERPTGTSRRIHVLDAKDKLKPKAVERLLWTKGLVSALGIDSGYVATKDRRPFLRKLASELGLALIDGEDISRIRASASVASISRLTDVELIGLIQRVDKERRGKDLQSERVEVLSSLSEGFGAGSLVRSLECFSRLARSASTSHPGSASSEAYCRLSYLAAAIAVASLDYVSMGLPFRSTDERRELILAAVRYGALDLEDAESPYKIALSIVRKYGGSHAISAASIEAKIEADFASIPAEIVADQAARLVKDGRLFSVATELEGSCYDTVVKGFDEMGSHTKSMLGALLDYASVNRADFASAVVMTGGTHGIASSHDANGRDDLASTAESTDPPQESLFEQK